MAEYTRTEYQIVVEQPGGPVALGPQPLDVLEARAAALRADIADSEIDYEPTNREKRDER